MAHHSQDHAAMAHTVDEEPTPASSQVLDTAELLETILLEVDIKTLLLSQRVNVMFKSTIKGSIKLQRALWFQPKRLDFDDDASGHGVFRVDDGFGRKETVAVNPLLFKGSVPINIGQIEIVLDNSMLATFSRRCPLPRNSRNPMFGIWFRDSIYGLKAGSWQDMLLFNDQGKNVESDVGYMGLTTTGRRVIQLSYKCDSGCRVGSLIDGVKKAVEKDEEDTERAIAEGKGKINAMPRMRGSWNVPFSD